ncbi:nitrogen regulation protein NR(II) [Thiohalomonas denitrificans]|uniref:nitrogen regulation protein NR(II) n=1 Tax=Thiohalomonas denitrificans TaxID=415747 RepID=UPI0026ED7071|nr:nitrogen regulation protein NR(II) [Thiohalomonas denitrificans]
MQLSPELTPRILENLHTAVMVFDADLKLGYLNPAGEMLFAVSARRVIGVHARELLAGGDLVDALANVFRSGHPFTERELAIELPASGEWVTVDLTALPLSDPQHAREILVEMSQVDRQLRITREETLLSQSSATRALVRGLAHEIKNPLGGLRGAAQLLERELDDEELKEYTRIIIEEADRLQSLMNRMLGPNALPRQRLVNIHEVLERVRQVVGAETPPGVTIDRDYDPSIPELTADSDQLIQSVMNLVRNAVQAVGESGRTVLRTRTLRQYTIGHTLHKLVARIDVIDNGPGISEEVRESVFLPMVTGRPGGTGLGLPIAQSLINAHGGLIECDSRPGRTVFTVLLPLT